MRSKCLHRRFHCFVSFFPSPFIFLESLRSLHRIQLFFVSSWSSLTIERVVVLSSFFSQTENYLTHNNNFAINVEGGRLEIMQRRVFWKGKQCVGSFSLPISYHSLVSRGNKMLTFRKVGRGKGCWLGGIFFLITWERERSSRNGRSRLHRWWAPAS